MSYTYSQYVTGIANMIVLPPTDANYLTALPNFIDDAEQRMYRDLDLLATVVRDTSGTLTANSRDFTFPQHIVVSEAMSVFTPVGTTTNRNQLVPATREFIDAIYGSDLAPSTPSIPQYYAMITDQTVIVGPSPDAAYKVELTGTVRPTPLSETNPTTYLTLYLPDLFFTASLIFAYGYLKDYGASTDDPNAAASWASHYDKTIQGAMTEEQRKKYAAAAWTSKQPAPLATPARA